MTTSFSWAIVLVALILVDTSMTQHFDKQRYPGVEQYGFCMIVAFLFLCVCTGRELFR